MKRIFTLFFAFFTFASIAFAQCPSEAFVNGNGNRLFLVFDTADERDAFFADAGGNVPMSVNPGGIGTLFETSSPIRLRIDIAFPSGPYTGTIASQAGQVCTYVDGILVFALPISLTDFTAKKMEQSILLQWKTQTETNNDRFIVERSSDGKDFEQLTAISGSGNSTEEVVYTFEDKNPKSATNYYRLRQIDYNGEESFSDVISMSMDFMDTREDLILYPTLVEDQINFDLMNFQDENLTLEILDATGHVVLNKTIVNNEIITFNLSNLNLTGGMYYARCRSTSKVATGKFFVIK